MEDSVGNCLVTCSKSVMWRLSSGAGWMHPGCVRPGQTHPTIVNATQISLNIMWSAKQRWRPNSRCRCGPVLQWFEHEHLHIFLLNVQGTFCMASCLSVVNLKFLAQILMTLQLFQSLPVLLASVKSPELTWEFIPGYHLPSLGALDPVKPIPGAFYPHPTG